MALKPVSVSQLNSYIARILQTDPIVSDIGVLGEVSNLTRHSSGHWYFALKDSGSRVNCFLSRDRVASLRFPLEEGMQIVAYGGVNVYQKGGYYSLNIRDIQAEGEGTLKQAFELLKKKLSDEGLFDEARKRKINPFPRRIGVITSPTGAAVRDIIITVKRRNPFVDILVYPCLVQGDGSADSIAKAIEEINKSFPDIDTLIVGRGGGSQEDLWSFNEEIVARAVFNSRIPVISAVGHEQDVVISDYVADLRGATPTAAAELATTDIGYLRSALAAYSPQNMFTNLYSRIENSELRLDSLKKKCDTAVSERLADSEHNLKMLKLELDGLNPLSVLDKGFALVKRDGVWITDSSALTCGDRITIRFRDASCEAVISKTGGQND